jgi:hypothetical protein
LAQKTAPAKNLFQPNQERAPTRTRRANEKILPPRLPVVAMPSAHRFLPLRRPHVLLALLLLCVAFFLRLVSRSTGNADACVIAESLPRYAGALQTLPKLLHVQWRTRELAPGSMQANVLARYQALFPELEIRIWTDDEMQNLVAADYAWFLPLYKSYPQNIQRVDSARYFILHKYGGLYSDLDYMPLRDFWDVLSPGLVSLAESPIAFAEKVQNSMMASPPRHPFWLEVFAELKARGDLHRNSVSESGGTAMLSHVASQHPEHVFKLPCQVFMRLSPMRFTDNDVVTGFFYKYILFYTPAMGDCGVFNLQDECMWAAHYGTNTWAKSFMRK